MKPTLSIPDTQPAYSKPSPDFISRTRNPKLAKSPPKKVVRTVKGPEDIVI